MAEEVKTDKPAVQASIVHQITGIEIRAEDIKAKTPEQVFEAAVTAAGLPYTLTS